MLTACNVEANSTPFCNLKWGVTNWNRLDWHKDHAGLWAYLFLSSCFLRTTYLSWASLWLSVQFNFTPAKTPEGIIGRQGRPSKILPIGQACFSVKKEVWMAILYWLVRKHYLEFDIPNKILTGEDFPHLNRAEIVLRLPYGYYQKSKMENKYAKEPSELSN